MHYVENLTTIYYSAYACWETCEHWNTSICREFLIQLCLRRKNQGVWNCISQVGVLEQVTFVPTTILTSPELVPFITSFGQEGTQMFIPWHSVPFSVWVTTVQSPKQDGQQSACEVTLVHYEDMGIPKDVAKVGVRHGMWGAVKKFQSGFRAYQQMRDTENTLSRSAIMARVTTKTSIASSSCPLDQEPSNAAKTIDESENSRAVQPGFDWKWVVFGGAVAAVCVLNTGLVGKALLIGAASRRQAKKWWLSTDDEWSAPYLSASARWRWALLRFRLCMLQVEKR